MPRLMSSMIFKDLFLTFFYILTEYFKWCSDRSQGFCLTGPYSGQWALLGRCRLHSGLHFISRTTTIWDIIFHTYSHIAFVDSLFSVNWYSVNAIPCPDIILHSRIVLTEIGNYFFLKQVGESPTTLSAVSKVQVYSNRSIFIIPCYLSFNNLQEEILLLN